MGKRDLKNLLTAIETASGADPRLDAKIDNILRNSKEPGPAYTASVDSCLELIHDVLPDWHWHVGRGAGGVMPYASLSKGNLKVVADGVTVPLVILAATVKALSLQ